MIVSISTVPIERSAGIFEATKAKALRVIAGAEIDPHFFAWLCEMPRDLNPEDPTNCIGRTRRLATRLRWSG